MKLENPSTVHTPGIEPECPIIRYEAFSNVPVIRHVLFSFLSDFGFKVEHTMFEILQPLVLLKLIHLNSFLEIDSSNIFSRL